MTSLLSTTIKTNQHTYTLLNMMLAQVYNTYVVEDNTTDPESTYNMYYYIMPHFKWSFGVSGHVSRNCNNTCRDNRVNNLCMRYIQGSS